MLKKYQPHHPKFSIGTPVYLVTREGNILEGFFIQKTLGDLIMLNDSPLLGAKQGFSICEERLQPNWCEGKKKFRAACLTRSEAEKIAQNLVNRPSCKSETNE